MRNSVRFGRINEQQAQPYERWLTYEQPQNISEEAETAIQAMQVEYDDELEHIKENGFRETTEWRDTTHNSIYVYTGWR